MSFDLTHYLQGEAAMLAAIDLCDQADETGTPLVVGAVRSCLMHALSCQERAHRHQLGDGPLLAAA